MITLLSLCASHLFHHERRRLLFRKIRFHGLNFPSNGPVIQKNTVKWEPFTEKMYVRDGVLKGDDTVAEAAAITDVTSKVLTSKFPYL